MPFCPMRRLNQRAAYGYLAEPSRAREEAAESPYAGRSLTVAVLILFVHWARPKRCSVSGIELEGLPFVVGPPEADELAPDPHVPFSI